MRCCIIEDELHAQRAIIQLVKLVASDVEVIGTARSVEEGIKLIDHGKPDFIFLDIKLGSRSGFDLLQHYPQPDFSILFVTAYNEYAIDAFKWNAVHYITKPIDSEDLKEALNRVRQQQLMIHPHQVDGLIDTVTNRISTPKYLILKYDNIIDRQPLDDIIRFEANGAITYIYCIVKELLSAQKEIKRKVLGINIGFYERILPNSFYRCHQSHIVNRAFVNHYNKSENYLLLLSEDKIPVSRRGKEGLDNWLRV
jgi:two-component system LytT family response regulator